MAQLLETAQALWNAINAQGYYDSARVLILADCLEEAGDTEGLVEGLRQMVILDREPLHVKASNTWDWSSPVGIRTGGADKFVVTKEVYYTMSLVDSYPHCQPYWRVYGTLSKAIRAFALAYKKVNKQ